MEWINYQHLLDKEFVSNLYADYNNNFDKVSKFYAGNYKEKDDWGKKIHNLQNKLYDRSSLLRILNDQNRDYHSGIKTLANIDLLGNENTFAVVTGQQLGMLTGPLYTIYKAITAVKLAEKLTHDFPEFNFVPIFWLEGEDHDFEEINKARFTDASNEIATAEYLLGGKPLERNIGATGSIIIDEFIDQFFASIDTSLPKTDYTTPLLADLRGYYKKGGSFLKAFASLFNHIYENSGLIFINPNTPEFKKNLSALFVKEINANSETSKLVIQKSAEIEEHYHAQIKAKALNLFMFHKGGRFLIEPSENGDYYLKNTRQRFTKEELLTMADKTPDQLSPNVILRPLCQDTLLPTIAYVGGPAEIAYFAQLKPVYEYFDVEMPIIYPRASISIVEEKVKKVLEKYSLEVNELFGDIDSILSKVSEQVSEVKIDSLFETLETQIKESVNEARYGIQQIDPTLNGTVDGTLSKFLQQLEVLKHKAQKAQQQKEEISLKQIRKAALNIFPNSNFQEREFSVIQYLNKYGPDFVKWISNEIVIDKFQHQVVSI
ncbi:MAG: bacillithiol biosynthesis cysteine-adding enzyme BshC [Bacteroidota bacterium]|nr:bacillithiol biosynthesis cysteine-adding enzyme BshC [Bacteroidota bacterium]